MPNPYISLTDDDPDLLKIQRQQRLADMLQQQVSEPIPINSSGGVQAPISPFSVLAKALKGYSARNYQDKADEQLATLQTSRQKELADMLSRQYQVPGQPGQAAISPQQTTLDATAPVIPGAASPEQRSVAMTLPGQEAVAPTAARPTTPQEQMANALSMVGSRNPQARQIGLPLYQSALEKQQAQQMLGGLDLSNVPDRIKPVIQAQIRQGDTAGALKTYQDATKPMVVGGALMGPTATGYSTLAAPEDASIKEYKFAQTQGFKGSLADWQKLKAQNTHITVDNGAGWQVVNGPDGQPFRYNPRNAQATDLQGRPLAGGAQGYSKIGVAGTFNLSPTEQSAIDNAIKGGKLDPLRLTRGNAKTIADTLVTNPDTDVMNIHAYAQQFANPILQRTAQQAARIPGMLDTVAASGKALGYSDAQFIGKLQQWKNGQLNDPAFTRYMTQRNDALLSMAGAFRGNGVTDLATQLEEEAAKPTMSPAAIDAWKQAHMDVLQPTLDFYKNYQITNPRTGVKVNTPAPSQGAASPNTQPKKAIHWNDLKQ